MGILKKSVYNITTIVGIIPVVLVIGFYCWLHVSMLGNPITNRIMVVDLRKYIKENFEGEYTVKPYYNRNDVDYCGKVQEKGEADLYFLIYHKDGEYYNNYFDYYWMKQARDTLYNYFNDIGVEVEISFSVENKVRTQGAVFRFNTEYSQLSDKDVLPDYSDIKDSMRGYLYITLEFPNEAYEPGIEKYDKMYEYFLFIKENTPPHMLTYKYNDNRHKRIQVSHLRSGKEIEINSLIEFRKALW